MDCSQNETIFRNDPFDPWVLEDSTGRPLYCNGSYEMDWVCNATIKADTDIAGPGVITSFILVAWLTVLVAMIPAYYELLAFLSKARQWSWPSKVSHQKRMRSIQSLRNAAQLRRALSLDRGAYLRDSAFVLLGSLCDLQICTGLAIAIAGLAQIRTISFYHQEIAMSSWWLTLTSFWAGRIEYMDPLDVESTNYTGRATVRRMGVLVSVILGMTFQVLINVREEELWDSLQPGCCYHSHDETNDWPWVYGTSAYAISLFFIIVPATRPWVGRYVCFLHKTHDRLIEIWKSSVVALKTSYSLSSHQCDLSSFRAGAQIFARTAHFAFCSFCLVLYWLFLQFMTAWAFGDGFYPLLILVYAGFAIWNTLNIIDLKLSNAKLIDGQESSWGFGQVLPMVLLLTIGYSAVDASRSTEQHRVSNH